MSDTAGQWVEGNDAELNEDAEDVLDTDDHGEVNDMAAETAVDEDTIETVEPGNQPG